MRNKLFIKNLSEISKKDFPLVGGKGMNLGEMIAAGLPVPEGFVITTRAYKKFIKDNDLKLEIYKLLQNIRTKQIDDMDKISKEIRHLIIKSSIPNEIVDEIIKSYNELFSGAAAVRSSSTSEDLPGFSFAGQYDTFLNVSGIENIIEAVKKSWASLWNTRALSYRIKNNISNQRLGHAVVVQKLIKSEKSGVMFTVNPLNGRFDQILINSSWGLGESIVSGEVTPDQWVMNKKSMEIIEEIISEKRNITLSTVNGTETKNMASKLINKPSLQKEELYTLLELSKRVEAYFKTPQDIEWAWYGGTCYLVQTRPITSLFPMPESMPDYENDLRVYMNFNLVGQQVSEPFTPMGIEFWKYNYIGYVEYLSGRTVSNEPDWFKVAGGRIFIDLTHFLRNKRNWRRIADNLSPKDSIFSKILLEWLEKNKEIVLNKKGYRPNFRFLFVVSSILKQIIYGRTKPESAIQDMLAIGESEYKDIKNNMYKLMDIDSKLQFIEQKAKKLAIMNLREAFYVIYGLQADMLVEEKLKKYFGNNVDLRDLYKVRQSLENNPTTEMGLELLRIANHYNKLSRKIYSRDGLIVNFMEKYGHRAAVEIDIGNPRWKENPEYVIDMINSYIKAGGIEEKIEKFNKGIIEAEEAINRLVSFVKNQKGIRKAKEIRNLLELFRRTGGYREQPKFDWVRSISLLREILKSIGKELANKDLIIESEDIFFLTFEDIRSRKNLYQIVKRNKDKYYKNLEIKSTPRIITNVGETIYSIRESIKEGILSGIPVSPGVYEGIVRIVHRPEGARLQRGEILVTEGTNPAWTPLFLNVGALIMETGGPISHGGIVAREYGIPAVAGVYNATKRLKNGQRIRVNGESGQIVILKEDKKIE